MDQIFKQKEHHTMKSHIYLQQIYVKENVNGWCIVAC